MWGSSAAHPSSVQQGVGAGEAFWVLESCSWLCRGFEGYRVHCYCPVLGGNGGPRLHIIAGLGAGEAAPGSVGISRAAPALEGAGVPHSKQSALLLSSPRGHRVPPARPSSMQ